MKRLVIGRSEDDCDLGIPDDDEISKQNCELTLEDGMVYIRDMGSTNGTFVNGVPIAGRYRLQTDDIILMGRTEFRVFIPEKSES